MSWQQEAERRRQEAIQLFIAKKEAAALARKKEESAFWNKYVTPITATLDDIGRQWEGKVRQTSVNGLRNCYTVKKDRKYMEIGLTLWYGSPDMRLANQRIGSELDQPLSGTILISLLAEPTCDKNWFLLYYAAGRPGWDCETPEQFTDFRMFRQRLQSLWGSGELITEGFHYFDCKRIKALAL